MLKLLYFFKLVDLLGCSQEELKLPEGVVNVADLLAWLGQRGENYRAAITINKKFVDAASVITDGDEIAFFPQKQ
jgi:molybdopterin synthase sulfur carrier subunit